MISRRKIRRLKKELKFLIVLVILSVLAAGVSLYAAWYIEKFDRYAPDHYEPKDGARQELLEETGKSVTGRD